MVEKALAALRADKGRAVYIGDSEVDIQTARNAGLDELIVTWGFRSVEELRPHGPKAMAADPEEVYRAVAG